MTAAYLPREKVIAACKDCLEDIEKTRATLTHEAKSQHIKQANIQRRVVDVFLFWRPKKIWTVENYPWPEWFAEDVRFLYGKQKKLVKSLLELLEKSDDIEVSISPFHF